MNQDDLILAREVRRLLERHPIDLRLTVVTHYRGWINVSGQVRAMRSQPFIKVRDELAVFESNVMRHFGTLKGVLIDARIIELPKPEAPGHELPPPTAKSKNSPPATRQ